MATIVAVRGTEGVRYRAQVRLRGAAAQSATFERKSDARRWATQVESEIRQGRFFKTTESRRHTLADLVDRYLREINPQRPRSMRDRGRHLLWWKKKLGHLALSDVTPSLLAEYRDRLRSGTTVQGHRRGTGTTNRYLGSLSHAFTIAVREWSWIEENPCRKVRRMTEPQGRVRFLSTEERERLLASCQASSNRLLYPLVLLALSTGARRGELLDLRWGSIDFERRTIRLDRTKNGDRRALPLTGPAYEEIRRFSRLRRIDTDLVFPGQNGSASAGIRAAWDKAVERAEIENFRFHDLRHTAASYLAMSGATPAEIAEVLGHRTLAMVQRYAHLSADHVAGVVARMNEKFLGTSPG